jgi:GNAT superfamily N-acetyltransferase
MVEMRRLDALTALAPLVAASAGEGFRFLERLCREWMAGEARFDGPGEVLLGAYRGPALVAVGGVTRDPYGGDPDVGRLRHLYVAPEARRQGTGASLVRALEDAARPHFRALVLRTDTAQAARFYEALGYQRLPTGGTATHRRELASSSLPGKQGSGARPGSGVAP